MITRTIRKEPGMFPLHDVRVIDGDTIEATIILPFGQTLRARVRLKGWWADEPTGLYAASGQAAFQRLTSFCRDKVLWLLSPGERRDRYGRIVGLLVHQEQIVSPWDVLGKLQLTEATHKLHRDQNLRAAEQNSAS